MFTRVAARTDRLPPAGPFLEVLQAIRHLLARPECFRLEREFAGWKPLPVPPRPVTR